MSLKEFVNVEAEIERLENLLKGRREEYEIFGATSVDLGYDNKIRDKIKELQNKLLINKENKE